MGLFSKTTKEVKKKAPKAKASVAPKAPKVKKEKVVAVKAMKGLPKDISGKLSNIISAPWLSEKALIGTEKGVYVFAIPTTATKIDVALAVQKIYNVVPRKVNVVNLPGKRKALKTRRGFGVRAGKRKAYVFLNKGETIQFA